VTDTSRDAIMRRALWATAVFNLLGALTFVFPADFAGLTGFPTPVPRVYTALLTVFVLLFAGAYVWLARQPCIDRPLVALAAVGKAGAFAAVFVCWLAGQIPGRAALAFSGDAVFAAIFTWWLVGDPAASPAGEFYHTSAS